MRRGEVLGCVGARSEAWTAWARVGPPQNAYRAPPVPSSGNVVGDADDAAELAQAGGERICCRGAVVCPGLVGDQLAGPAAATRCSLPRVASIPV